MTDLKGYASISDILIDPRADKELKKDVLEAIKPLHEQFIKNAYINGDRQLTPVYRTCQKLNHCPARNVKDMSVQGYTVAPTFNIYGPSGKQSLSAFRTMSHTGKIILEGAKASGQFSIDAFKGGAQDVVTKNLKKILKDKVKGDTINALINPNSYAYVTIYYKKQNYSGSNKTTGPLYVGSKKALIVPDHHEVFINVRVDPLMPMRWKITVQAADYLNRL